MKERELYALADRMADRYGLSPYIFRRMIQQESGFNPRARNDRTGATGLAQVMAETARDPGYGVKPLEDRYDPVESLRFGAEYLRAMLDKFGGDYGLALAAYNSGPGTVEKAGGIPAIDETRQYVKSILETQIPPPRPADLGTRTAEPVPVPMPMASQRNEAVRREVAAGGIGGLMAPPPRPVVREPRSSGVPIPPARPVLTAAERLRGVPVPPPRPGTMGG